MTTRCTIELGMNFMLPGGGKDSKEAGGGIETDTCASPAGDSRELDSLVEENTIHFKSASRRHPSRKKILK